jgi:hypothetical protein
MSIEQQDETLRTAVSRLAQCKR